MHVAKAWEGLGEAFVGNSDEIIRKTWKNYFSCSLNFLDDLTAKNARLNYILTYFYQNDLKNPQKSHKYVLSPREILI
jgi:hypothetical protein